MCLTTTTFVPQHIKQKYRCMRRQDNKMPQKTLNFLKASALRSAEEKEIKIHTDELSEWTIEEIKKQINIGLSEFKKDITEQIMILINNQKVYRRF